MNIPKHGGDTFGREIRYDFSANLNPLGMPQSVKKALENSTQAVRLIAKGEIDRAMNLYNS